MLALSLAVMGERGEGRAGLCYCITVPCTAGSYCYDKRCAMCLASRITRKVMASSMLMKIVVRVFTSGVEPHPRRKNCIKRC